eukprot:g23576.t1
MVPFATPLYPPDVRRLVLHSNLSTIGLSLAIEGSNWWSSCGDHMHACSGSWLPEEKKYCCCDAGYMWTSSRICSETLVFGGPTSAPDGFGTKPGQVRDMDADAAEHWVAKVLKDRHRGATCAVWTVRRQW